MASWSQMKWAAIFDFDLTLVDSRAGFLEASRYAFTKIGLPIPPPDRIVGTIGTPIDLAFPMLVAPEHTDRFDDYAPHYQQRADEVMTGLTTVLPGAAAAVRALRERGVKLAIVSQKLRRRIEPVLEREGLREVFDAVLGGEDLAAFKPDPDGLLKAARALAVTPNDAVFIGDTVIDAEAAQRAGMTFVAVLSGVTPAAAFEVYKPRLILSSAAELPAHWPEVSS
jgi:phosphoglycolate phosphatase